LFEQVYLTNPDFGFIIKEDDALKKSSLVSAPLTQIGIRSWNFSPTMRPDQAVTEQRSWRGKPFRKGVTMPHGKRLASASYLGVYGAFN
jgi:hypothetical protein